MSAPVTISSFFSKLTFYYLFRVVNIAKKRPIIADDIENIAESQKCGFLLDKVTTTLQSNPKQTLFGVIFHEILGGYKYIFSSILSPIIGDICYLLSIEFMRRILIAIHDDIENMEIIYYYVIGIGICQVIFVFYHSFAMFWFERDGIIVSKLVKALIVDKSLLISENSFDSANIITIITSDAQRIVLFFYYLPNAAIKVLVSSPLMILYLCFITDSFLPFCGLLYLILATGNCEKPFKSLAL
eukprot:93334_1